MSRFAFVVALPFLLTSQTLLLGQAAVANDILPMITFNTGDGDKVFDLEPFDSGNGIPRFTTTSGVKEVGGTIFDPDGLDRVWIQIAREIDDVFWNGSEWQDSPHWIQVPIDVFSWSIGEVDFSMPTIHSVRIASVDQAGNYTNARDLNLRIFSIVDTTPPEGSLSLPFANRVFSAPPQTVTEPGNTLFAGSHDLRFSVRDQGVGVSDVFSQVVHVDSGEYWNGLTWQPDPAWCPMFQNRGITSRYEAPGPIDLSRLGRYVVRMHLRDYAGNIAAAGDNAKYELLVVADNEAPVALLTRPSFDFAILPDGSLSTPGQTAPAGVQNVSGKVRDVGTGGDEVRVQIFRDATSEFWNGFSWQATPAWVVADVFGPVWSSRNWSISDVDLTLPGSYAVRLVAYDAAGNRSVAAENWRTFLNVAP